MGIFGRKVVAKREIGIEALGTLLLNTAGDIYTPSKAEKIAAVYRAVNVISDSVAILPINVFKYDGTWKKRQYNELYYLLNVQPNRYMSAYQFKKLMIVHLKLRGNAYVYIDRNVKNEIKNLYIIHPERVKVEVTEENTPIYRIDGVDIPSDNIIHLVNYTTNGVYGLSTLEYARSSLETSFYTTEHQKNFFQGGANLNGILHPKEGVYLSREQAEDAKVSFINQINPLNGGKSGGIVVLSSDLDFKPISITPRDAQLLESKEFTLLDIAQFFGVPLSKLFYTKNNKYNTIEAEQLDFLTTTIQPIIEMIEVEMFRKLFMRMDWGQYELKFDVSNLMRLDAKSQADVYVKLLNAGAITPNEIRDRLDADYPVVGGNKAFVQQNLQPLDNLTNTIKSQGNE